MREIKYRYVFRSTYDGGWGKELRINTYTIKEIERGNVDFIRNDNWALVNRDEYTGLKDKNGKEIYEGDIVHQFGGKNHLVEFKDCAFRCGGFPLNAIHQSEVIGNIYENPELLDKGEIK
jgi:hypothetical protein